VNRSISSGRGAVALAALLVLAFSACSPAPAGTATRGPTTTGPAAGAASPSAPATGSVAPSAAPGGKVAEDLVATLHGDPFIAHIEESILASSRTGSVRITLTAKAVGDVSGRDAAIHATGTGGGPPVDQETVAVGDVAWTRKKGAATWDVHPRTDVASSLDGLLTTIRLIDDPSQLVDLGVEDLDGASLHHLTAAGSVAYRGLTGVEGSYDTFDVWATDKGVPVLMKATFSEVQGINSITGGTEIRYTKVGGPITIAPPAGAPSRAP